VRLMVAFVSTGLIAFLLLGSVMGRVFGDTAYGQLTLFNEVLRHILDGYVDPLSPERLDRAMAAANMGLTDALDSDTAYLEPEDWKAYQEGVKPSDADVGIVLGRRFGFLMVVATTPGSPAEKAGVRGGDFIKTIDGRHTRAISVVMGERLLRGAPGSTVALRLLRSQREPTELSIVRERLSTAPVRSRTLADGAGYVKVAEFTGETAKELRDEIESLKRAGVRSVVLDLRGAARGALAEGAKAAELFVGTGVIARKAQRVGAEDVTNADASRVRWSGPIVTLVDSGTAGPAEIVAAALKDSGRSSLVGQRTFGRVGIQQAVPLQDGGMVVTVARYLSPKGEAIHGRGIEPDVPVAARRPHDLDEDDEEEEEGAPAPGADPALDKALEILKTAATKKAA
jgi:carboxyl-terminal processing protease